MSVAQQVLWLLILPIPVAMIVRAVVFEEIFREPRDWCVQKSHTCRRWYQRKFFYIFTCDFCFSHWVSLAFILISGFQLLLADWRGYVISFFAVTFMANLYLNLYALLRLDIRRERAEVKNVERRIEP